MAELIVEVKQGKLRGKRTTTEDGFEYCAYWGIPYAKPPIANLRFKDPLPADSWSEIRDATEPGSIAAQFDLFTKVVSGSDDSLFVNVFVPSTAKKGDNLAVMVFIHGGGFITGSGADLGPDYIVSENVIMATLNYRLGVMGYLCTDAVNARGDMGLKDQNLALKWIKSNIHSFGGDSDNITLFGISAGSSSVEYQLLAKSSKGLFHKAILQSGSTLNPWARQVGGVKVAEKLARKMGYTGDAAGVFDFINAQETLKLVETSANITDSDDNDSSIFGFAPTINELEGYSGFIEGEPVKLLESGSFTKIPTITGLCEKEGMMMQMMHAVGKSGAELEKRNFNNFMPFYLKNKSDMENALAQVYTKKPTDKNDDDDIMDFASDLYFNGGCVYALQKRLKHSENENNYFYNFCYDGNQNMVKTLLQITKVGACHGDDSAYLGVAPKFIPMKNPTASDLEVRNNMVKMWTNFAKVGNPTPGDLQWMPSRESDLRYLHIDIKCEMRSNFNPERTALWNEIYNKMNVNNVQCKY